MLRDRGLRCTLPDNSARENRLLAYSLAGFHFSPIQQRIVKITDPPEKYRKMCAPSDAPQPLYWESSYEIILELMARYPETNLDTLGLQELFQMIVTLPNFVDDPALAHDELLTEILREYYEEATNP